MSFQVSLKMQRTCSMSLWQLRIKADKDAAYKIGELLEGHVDVISLFEDSQDQSLWVVEGTCQEELSRQSIEDLLETVESTEEPITLEINELSDKDWLAENRKDFPPLEIAGFYIYGSHIENPEWGSQIPLKIEASTAFGTGNHGTTHGCLEALQYLKDQGIHPRNPLDLGCGTGILALGIAKIFGVKVTASDIDPEATEKTLYNAAENDAADLITAYTAEGLESDILASLAPFDLIVANILAGPLIDMAPQIKGALSKGGYLILSGLLDHQVTAIKEAYLDAHLILVQKTLKGDWATLIFKTQTLQDGLKSRMDFSIKIQGQ
ncbi:MAG TPA: 50S ribosomal protein L11 methyltransferase [Holosporales bacterium]|nr:50S ribosomal protein L11 methyltransferase [Holosporales bacterium]